MRRALPTAVVAALALAFVPAAAAHGPEAPATVSILFQAFGPAQMTVLAGEPVTWMNTSPREHTVTARDGRFDSGVLPPHGSFVQGFGDLGSHPYFCRIHPTMQGTVDVRALLLEGPAGAVADGAQVELAGRAIAGLSQVEMQEDRGGGFRTVSTAPVTGGKFHALVRPQASTTYRAVAGALVSPSVRVVVGRPLALAARRRGRRSTRLTVTADPPQPGGKVVLQTYLKERFGWWPVARRRLDRSSRARFSVRRRSRGRRVRVVLTEPDGVTPREVSNVVTIKRASRKR